MSDTTPTKNTTTLFYLRDPQNHPYATVAMRMEGEQLRVAYAVCHPEQRGFEKRHARNKVMGRLKSTKQSRLVSPGARLSQLFRASLYYDFPNRDKMEEIFQKQQQFLLKHTKAA